MSTARQHYDHLLADLYSWMMGELEPRIESQLAWLRGVVGAASTLRSCALDLGAGPGAEAIALARLGYDVVAVDASQVLVAELRARVVESKLGRAVTVVESDLVTFLESDDDREREPASLAVCLGDTLTHLDSPATVRRMFRAARARVTPGGALVLTYRDLSAELRELDRFFLVRADASRILTCFVEYVADGALIHDLVHERTEGGWQMRKSFYPKLRLPVAQVTDWLVEAGFHDVARVPCAGGLVGLVGR